MEACGKNHQMKYKMKGIDMKRYLIGMFLACCSISPSLAQTDPTLASMIAIYTDKAKSELKSQEKAMALETTGHIWIKEEVKATTDFQREFNNYLDSFNDIICYAAQIYGFYYEIGKMTDNMGALTKQLKAHPANAFAVALTPKRNQIYRDILTGSVEIVNDIRQVCLSDVKMTEKERAEIVFAIRPKLKKMNRKLTQLTLAVKYTSMGDVWAEIEDGASQHKTDKLSITQAAMKRWKRCGKL
jgi:hypothetical protein